MLEKIVYLGKLWRFIEIKQGKKEKLQFMSLNSSLQVGGCSTKSIILMLSCCRLS